MELLHGSPADMTGRSSREIRSYEFLDSLGIEFDRTDHPDQPATSMEVCEKVDEVLGSVTSNPLQPHGLQHARLPYLSEFAQTHVH